MDGLKVDHILDVFDVMFPDAYCELNHSNHFELLVAVMLSAQTTDKSVNQLTEALFEKYKIPNDYANAPIVELEQDLKRIGLYKTKAKNVKKMSQILIDEYDGKVPDTREELEKLPGVGRKTANVVLSVCFDQPAFAVDTHVARVSKRLGIANENDTPLKIEKKLIDVFPEEKWCALHHQMIFFWTLSLYS
ncbi:Endonuclease III protein [Haloplasma contractile SSD-17B]|uniref:Endonuclease III n=1 Tax=Haloplasma contractile SSD-17B TaxID=1033810 RepID=U2ECL0_9MOLU|nr:endonuclease III [Haloplasma contractile]ERJ12788.1 Endonuclease III protein [Haloplasma contractile SSD-17B]